MELNFKTMFKKCFFLPFLISLFTFYSCQTNKTSTNDNAAETELWEQGISMVTGEITGVKQEKDGQTIRLRDNKGTEYTAVISIPNLGDKAGQYREFKVGETISFKGNLNPDNRMVVREVLEMK